MKKFFLVILLSLIVLVSCTTSNPNHFCPSVSPYKSVQPFVVISTEQRDSLIDERKGTNYTHVTKDMLVPDTLPYKYKYLVQQLNIKHPYSISVWCNDVITDTVQLVMCKTCKGTVNCAVGNGAFMYPAFCMWE